MAIERKEISGKTPCIGWLWGLLLVAAVLLVICFVLPLVVFLLLWVIP